MQHFQATRRLLVFCLLIFFFAPSPHAAAAQGVLQGLIVDQDGFGVARAQVQFHDAQKRLIATTRTNEAGRFSIFAAEPPSTWTVSAAGFATRTMRFPDPPQLVLVLYGPLSYHAVEISSADLAVLPYQDVGYAFSLQPFQVIQGGGTIGVGDRGLSGSANALENNGSSFSTVPAHYLSFAGISAPFQSYRYRNGAAGHYTIGYDRAAASSLHAGAGSFNVYNLFGEIPSAGFGTGTSSGDLTQRSRADLVSRHRIGAGSMLVTASNGYLTDASGSPTETENETDLRLRLDEPIHTSTATLELENDTKTKDKWTSYTEPGSSFKAELRIRQASSNDSAEYGVSLERDTGFRAYTSKFYQGEGLEERVFASMSHRTPRFDTEAAVTDYALMYGGATKDIPAGLTQRTSGVTISGVARWNFTEHFVLEAMGGNIEDTPSVSTQFFGDPVPALVLNRSNLLEANLRYQLPAGLSAEITEYKEKYTTGLPTTYLSGTGVSVDWQIAPEWQVRAWTLGLRDWSPGESTAALEPSTGRDVVWMTYEPANLRLDIIYRRETDFVEAGRYVDADAAFRIGSSLYLMGTMEHHRATSSYGVSLRYNQVQQHGH